MNELSRRARERIDGDVVLDLARRLVRVPSENPPGDTTAVCEIIAAELEPAGFSMERVEPEPGFVSLLAELRLPTPGRRLMLNGHVDVVPAGDGGAWSRGPWDGAVAGGRLLGRGSLDMKGPLAALIVAAREVAAAGLPLSGRLVLAAVADEESGGARGTGALVEGGKVDVDAVVIAEPGDDSVVVAHRGMCFVRVSTHGRGAHASMPAQGDNAVERMVDVLAAWRTVRLRHRPHPLLGSPSLALGTTIEGGRKINMVPDCCRATLDVRLVPGMTPAGVLEDLHAHLEAAGLPAPELEVVFGGEAGETDPAADIVAAATDAYEAEFGRRPRVRGMPAATDGWWFANRAGIPTVMGLGPGGIAGCHVVDESVDVVELERYARVYADLIVRFLGAAPQPGSPAESDE